MSEANLPESNPYASPQVDSSTPNDLPHFGLSAPICLEGVKTIDDMLRATEAIGGQHTWRRHAVAIGWILFLCLFPLIYLTQWLPWGYGINLAVAVVLVGLYAYRAFFALPRKIRRLFEESIGEGVFEQFLLGEESLVCNTETSSGEHRWERFSCYREAEGLLLLRLEGYSDVFVIPRSFCPREALWQTVLELIACKMPVWEQGKEPPPRKFQRLVTPAVILDEQLPGDDTIGASGQYTPRQLRRAMRLVQPYWPVRYLLLFFLMGGLSLWGAFRWDVDDPFRSLFPLGISLVLIPSLLGAARWNARKAWKEKRGPYEWQTWSISPDWLKVHTATTNQTFGWSLFVKAIRRETMVLLQLQNRTFFLFPRSFFASESDWLRFLELVAEKVKS